MPEREPILIQKPAQWERCFQTVRQHKRLAIDTESNGLFAYREQVCLIQISVQSSNPSHNITDYVIDPLALPKLPGMADLMADKNIEKIFHAAEYDLMCLKRDFDYEFNNLFDTMVVARALGRKKVGLAAILKDEFEVYINKRFQRANWGKRPLTQEQIDYARHDTHYLIPLRDRFYKAAKQANRLEEVQDRFQRLTQVNIVVNSFDPDDFWSLLNGKQDLSPQQNAVLRELYIFRDREAQRRGVPPFKVMSNRTLVELAELLPRFTDELQAIFGLSWRQIQRYGIRLLEVIQQGLTKESPAPPARRPRPSRAVVNRFDRLSQWRKVTAQNRGVESDVIVSKNALWALARKVPMTMHELSAIKELSQWQIDEYGSALLKQLRDSAPKRSQS
ncbi:MAG: HRDC domain-containing protein [Chloroflexota bacterium]